ncbi:hypothetical protein Q3G72_006450 [Acer saccharum]|nr:hypothetical protein Q3G72_006450 [Acer saccharum]
MSTKTDVALHLYSLDPPTLLGLVGCYTYTYTYTYTYHGCSRHPYPSSSTFQSRYDRGGLDHAAPRSQHANTVREGPPGVRTQRHESVIQSLQELRKEFKDFESWVQDRLEIALDELRDSNRRREEEHAELMRIFRSYRHNDDQSHTPLGHSLSMSQYARSYHPLDPPAGLQNSAEV